METPKSDISLPAFYTPNPFCYQRRKTKGVSIGGIYLGDKHPIRIQSMTNVSTLDTELCVKQVIRLYEAGSEYIRLSTPSIADAENLKQIKKKLSEKHCRVPLIADVHFNPKVAEIAAQYVEKVRINPGNYVDNNKQIYSETEYEFVIEQIANRLFPLLKICNKNGTAIRIGTNHGSLSQRIVNRYGNTPLGMAMSAMEFVGICNDFGFHNLVLSMKASNTKIMIESVRLLVAMLDEKGWNYPLHLGVTEAGNDEYGRIKSAAGIIPLLGDGIGDTIRVSLTETPENEIPFAKILAQRKYDTTNCNINLTVNYNPYHYSKREILSQNDIKTSIPFIVSDYPNKETQDINHCDTNEFHYIKPDENLHSLTKCKAYVFQTNENTNLLYWRKVICELKDKIDSRPFIWKFIYSDTDWMSFYAKASGDVASVAVDGFVDGIWIENPNFSQEQIYKLLLEILQACGLRFSQAEYIACPSCGRTQYNIEEVLQKIKEKTSHLRNLKIGVMGCIVNGPGEMADADYGFVGSGKGKICLYKGQKQIYSNIDEQIAIDKLMELIKTNGDWVEK